MPCVKLSKRCQNVKKMSKCQKDVKISKRCQNVKKMSNSQKDVKYQKVKHTDYGGGSQKKKKIHIMRFTHIDINFDIKYEGHQNCSKILFLSTFWGFLVTIIWDVKIDINMCEPHYVNLFFVNLLRSPCVWLFDIWHLFDNLTFFWHLATWSTFVVMCWIMCNFLGSLEKIYCT